MKNEQFELVFKNLKILKNVEGFYSQKLKNIDLDTIKSKEDFEKLPCTDKGELRDV